MFRFFGVVAAVYAWLGRRSFLCVPANVVAMGALALLTALSVGELRKPPVIEAPRPVSIHELAAGSVPAGSYVTVEAMIDARYHIEVTHRSVSIGRRPRARSWHVQFLPLVDDSGRVGLLLSQAEGFRRGRRVTVTGIVGRTPAAARDAVVRDAAMLPGRLNADLMLATGSPPKPGRAAAGACVVVAPVLMGMLAYVALRRGVIFTKDETPALRHAHPCPPDQPIDMRISAALRLEQGPPRRFVEAPAQAMLTNRGDVALGLHCDASIYLFGLPIWQRDGFWSVIVPAGAIEDVTRGDLAFGTDVRSAATVRLSGSRRPTVALSFATVEQRERFLWALDHHCGGLVGRVA